MTLPTAPWPAGQGAAFLSPSTRPSMTTTEDTFDRPFTAGSHARIHPGSLVVDFQITDAVLKAYDERYLLWDQSDDRRRAAGEPESFEEMPVESREFLSRHAHELDHLNRFLGTSFGFLCDTVRNQWLIRAGHLIRDRAAKRCQTLFPDRLYRPPAGTPFSDALRGVERYARSTSAAEVAFVGVADLLTALVDDVAPARFASALWGLTDGRPDLVPDLAGGVDVTEPMCAAFPTTDGTGRYFGLTARHLLELFAVREQGNSLLSMDAPLAAVNGLLADTRDEYVPALLVWREVFPPESDPTTHGAVVEFDWAESFPFELFAAADLALWPPFLPDTGFPFGSVTWNDIHPGRRFAKALGSLHRLSLPPVRFDAARQNEQFLGLQSRICADLGWPTPHEIASRWSAHLPSLGHGYWPVLDGPSTYRADNAKRLLAERLKRPAEIALNNVDVQSLGVEAAAAWVFTREAGGREVRPMSRSGYAALGPYWVLESVQHLVCPDRPLFGDAFDPLFRKTAAELAEVRLAGAGSWDAATVRRFRDETRRPYNL